MSNKKPFVVADEYRTNPLSLVEGGVTVRSEMKDGSKKDYTKIKDPDAYIITLLNNPEVKTAYLLK